MHELSSEKGTAIYCCVLQILIFKVEYNSKIRAECKSYKDLISMGTAHFYIVIVATKNSKIHNTSEVNLQQNFCLNYQKM